MAASPESPVLASPVISPIPTTVLLSMPRTPMMLRTGANSGLAFVPGRLLKLRRGVRENRELERLLGWRGASIPEVQTTPGLSPPTGPGFWVGARDKMSAGRIMTA